MNIRFTIALTFATALLCACGPRAGSASQSKPAALATAAAVKTNATGEIAERPHRRATSSAKSEPKLDSKFDVTVDPRAIHFVLGVTNTGKKHVELTFRSGQSYDFVVVDSIGREVWRWSAGRMFTQGVQNKQLSGGDSMHAKETWAKPIPGRYTAIATLNSTNFPTEQRADFVVP